MTEIQYDIREILKEYFGENGLFFLAGEIRDLGCETLDELNQEQRETLADAILEDLFAKILTDRHFSMIKHKVYKALGVPENDLAVMQE